MTYENLQKSFLENTAINLEARESLAVFWILLFHSNEWSRIQYEMHKKEAVPSEKQNWFLEATQRILNGEPVQYITGGAEFYGHTHIVNSCVLIPRPETEELVHWIISDQKSFDGHKYLDIGTGSGCIINSLALNLKGVFYGVDVSKKALDVAKLNSEVLESEVEFNLKDILNLKENDLNYDVIVSNPPYIPIKDISEMNRNVLDYEPEIALFVSNDDPLIFYKAIIRYGLKNLNKEGVLYFEIHESYKRELKVIVEDLDCSFEFRNDMQGKARMLKIWDLV